MQPPAWISDMHRKWTSIRMAGSRYFDPILCMCWVWLFHIYIFLTKMFFHVFPIRLFLRLCLYNILNQVPCEGLNLFAPDCASWGVPCRHTSGRSVINPHGHMCYSFVASANKMVARTFSLIIHLQVDYDNQDLKTMSFFPYNPFLGRTLGWSLQFF